MKFEIVSIRKIPNEAWAMLDSKAQLKEPDHLFEIVLALAPGGQGAVYGLMTLHYKYVPMLDVGASYTWAEISEA